MNSATVSFFFSSLPGMAVLGGIAIVLLSACAGDRPSPKGRAAITGTATAAQAPTLCRDADSDGVCDVDDKCPLTPANLKVDATGCAATFTLPPPAAKVDAPVRMVLPGHVLFGSDQSALSPAGRAEVDKLAALLKADPSRTAVIEGYTDSQGGQVLNFRLSSARAQAVRDDLVARGGIARSRLQAIGYADLRPVADNATDEGRARNRRVEVLLGARGADAAR
jgi:OOP family OmpA-OmpF porin